MLCYGVFVFRVYTTQLTNIVVIYTKNSCSFQCFKTVIARCLDEFNEISKII